MRGRIGAAAIAALVLLVVACAHGPERRPAGSFGGLVIQCCHDDAKVFVDGMLIGTTRDYDSEGNAYPLAAGRAYQVRVERPGYKAFQKEVYVAGGNVIVPVKLEKG